LVTCFATHGGITADATSSNANGFKHWRGLATRYDKHAIVYRGGLVLAAVLLWLTDLGDTS
jgi:transposase